MKVILGVNDAVVSDSQLLRLVNFGNSVDGEGGAEPLFDVEYAMNVLKEDPALGARLLQLCGRNNSVFWNGDQAGRMGVRVIPKPNSIEAAGTNLFGFFLADVRKEYLEYISENPVEEIAPAADAGRVVTDYFPSGEFDSEIALREKDGHKFIHVDYYRPKRFQFDANLSGTTGHAMRDSDSGVATNTFVCPFGTDYHYKVRVGSAAEASYLYESGIRGELDYNALLTSLEGRGLVGKMRPAEREALIRDLRGQFDWMREQICTDSELRRRDIVDVSALVPDDSFGRSVYDMYTAPSPGHVLSRYIQNPGLLFSASENSVLKALAERRKGEPERFEVLPGKDVVRIAVVGSDTIGGRQVGRKAVERSVLEAGEDEGGRQILKRKRRFDMPMKSDADISADYAAFAARMDSILAGVPEGTRVELWTGGVTSDKSRTGTARMAERYVNERNGNVLGWNFETEGRFASRPGPNNDISVVSMDFFNKCYPVLLGLEHEAEFYMDAADLDSLVTFKESPTLRMDGVVCFTVAAARDNSVVDIFGSMAARVGVPLVHVSENRSEQEQRSALASASQSIYSLLTGNQDFGASLFAVRPRDRWDVNGSTILSNVDTALSLAVPVVMQPFEGVVPVGSVSYHTPFGAFVAMLAQEAGRDTIDDLNSIFRSEERPMLLLASYREFVKGVSPEVEERCMRRAVRMMSVADTRFSSILTNAGGDIVLPDSLGETRLFVDLDGNGENRFGVVLGAERDYAAALVEERRMREEKERQEVLEENARRQKLEVSRKAPGEKVRGGLPERPEDFQGAVWLIGTSSAPGAEIQDGNRSFVQWDDMNGQDPLVREMVTRQTISDGEGGQVPNNFVFLYPTNLAVFTGKDRMYNRKPSSRELHDCERTDPETGQKFVCAYGIPVKMNKFVNEPNNEDHFPCSFRMDDSASDFVDSIVLSDALARTAAIRHKASLCAVAREGDNGELWFPMSYVFGPKAKVNGKWTDSPHAAPVCARNLDKYLSMLYLGRNYPLNCIPLPSDSYDFIPGNEESKESALRRLISDVLFSLKVANATALQLNVPLRVPLDQDGRIDLGPGIPEEFRDSVERRVNSFIGAVNAENLAGGPLPVLERASILDYSRYASQMKIAQDLYLRPNDLALAFGRYDFRELRTGGVAPLHEMFFSMEDGTFFDVRDAALNRGKSNEEVSDYIKYEKNDLRRFVIRTNNPDKAEEFTCIVKSYIDRAKKINVEYRLLRDSEKGAKDLGMEGFIVVRSSNDRDLISSSDVGPDAYTQARQKSGGTTDKAPILVGRETTIFNSVSHFDGNDNNGYDGWEDARDGFRGYVQIRYTLPDGSLSEWQTLTDPELVKPVTMFTLNRKYNTDGNDFIINDRTLKMFLTAEAVRMSGDRFRMMDVEASKVEAVSKEVDMKPQQSVSEAKAESHEKQPVESAGKGKVYVSYWGNRSIPEDAFLVQISTSAPKGLEADARLESAYPDYKEMVAPHKDGVIDDAEYTRRYHESVLDPNRERIVNEVKGLMEEAGGKDIYLMCYCRPGAFCHRYLLNNFLNENGIECQECPEDRIKYTEGHVRLYGEKDYVSGSELIPQRQMSEPSVFDPPVPEDSHDSGIVFSESSGRYAQRTFENANAPDVDFTLQLAVDFSTAGEKSTARAAKDSLISVRIPVAKNGGIDMSRKAVSEAVRTVIDTLPEEFINGEEIGLNLAGNGIYTLSKSGITQEQVDEFVCRVHAGLLEKGVKVQSYRSGGQTGVDAAAGALAEVFGVPVTIHAPHGWTFRNEKGADVSDKQAFQDRFVPKRYASLKQKLFPAAKKSQGKTM